MRLLLKVHLAVTIAFFTGCVGSDGPSFFVEGNGTLDDECVIQFEDPTLLLRGVYNPSGGFGYTLYPVFVNQLTQTGARLDRAEPNVVQITGAVVTLEEPGGAALDLGGLPNPYTVDVSAVVQPGDGSMAGRGGAGVDIIPGTYGPAIASVIGTASATVVLRTEFFGETVAGVSVEAPDWVYPLAVSNAANVQCSLAVTSTCGSLCQDSSGCPSDAVCECGVGGAPGCGTGFVCAMGTCVPET